MGQTIKLGDDINLTVTQISGTHIRFGIVAPIETNIVRAELINRHCTYPVKSQAHSKSEN
ncbi:carbon storage regulator [Nitrincola tibetensis]